jgi:hypothetical protein
MREYFYGCSQTIRGIVIQQTVRLRDGGVVLGLASKEVGRCHAIQSVWISGCGDVQIPTDLPRQVLLQFAVARHRWHLSERWIHVYRVVASFAQQAAPVRFQVTDEVDPLHLTLSA